MTKVNRERKRINPSTQTKCQILLHTPYLTNRAKRTQTWWMVAVHIRLHPGLHVYYVETWFHIVLKYSLLRKIRATESFFLPIFPFNPLCRVCTCFTDLRSISFSSFSNLFPLYFVFPTLTPHPLFRACRAEQRLTASWKISSSSCLLRL